MEEKLIKTADEYIEKLLKEDLTTESLENLYKLTKIKHIAKEDKDMYGNYGNYSGRRAGYDSYGRYGEYGNYGDGSYGRRGYDTKYRGDEYMGRMHDEYGRYMENRERYGAGEETNKAFEYMAHSAGDFIKYLFQEAETPQQKEMLRQELQNSMR